MHVIESICLCLISYAPWCPACQHLQTDWESLGRQSERLGISVGRVDVTQQPGLTIASYCIWYSFEIKMQIISSIYLLCVHIYTHTHTYIQIIIKIHFNIKYIFLYYFNYILLYTQEIQLIIIIHFNITLLYFNDFIVCVCVWCVIYIYIYIYIFFFFFSHMYRNYNIQ